MKMHLSLRVADLEKSVEFYRAFFGVAPHKTRPDYANFDLANPPLKFALTQTPHQSGGGNLDHLGFQVESLDELEAFKSRLKAAGLATFDEADATCCYARQDKVWAHDPDGNEWEIYLLTDDLPGQTDVDHAGNALDAGDVAALVQPAHRCCS